MPRPSHPREPTGPTETSIGHDSTAFLTVTGELARYYSYHAGDWRGAAARFGGTARLSEQAFS